MLLLRGRSRAGAEGQLMAFGRYGRFVDGSAIRRRMDEKDARMQLEMKRRTTVLPSSWSNCEHWDGDVHCALPDSTKLIFGHIKQPALVVCSRYDAKDRG